jgi:phage tail sheath gpL-like
MKRASLLLVAALAPVIASCDSAPAPTASRSAGDVTISETGTANASAVGIVRYTFGATTAHLGVIVNNSATSVTTGRAVYYTSAADVVLTVNVTCLHKSGGTATFLGTIDESSDASLEGKDASWQVVDGSPDQASLINIADAGTGPSCTTPGEFDLVNVSAGNITVS